MSPYDIVDLLGLNSTQAREIIAETLLIFDIGLLAFIVFHIRREVALRGFAGMRSRLGNQAAVAVGVHIFGLTIIRAWTTTQYYMGARGIDTAGVEEQYPVALIGLFIAMTGMACCIRIFSPERFGNWGWLLTVMAAIGFVGFMQAGV